MIIYNQTGQLFFCFCWQTNIFGFRNDIKFSWYFPLKPTSMKWMIGNEATLLVSKLARIFAKQYSVIPFWLDVVCHCFTWNSVHIPHHLAISHFTKSQACSNNIAINAWGAAKQANRARLTLRTRVKLSLTGEAVRCFSLNYYPAKKIVRSMSLATVLAKKVERSTINFIFINGTLGVGGVVKNS